MNELAFPIVLIIVAGFFQGTFGLGMKKFAPLSWEAFWLLFSIIGMVVVPFIWSSQVIPDADVIGVIKSVELETVLWSMFWGGCWGVGCIMFGLAIRYVGVSLCYGITMGLAAAVGSLMPLFNVENFMEQKSFPFIILGIAVMILGVVILTIAGIKRENAQAVEGKEIAGIERGFLFKLGLLFAILNGVGAGLLNKGFSTAEPIAKAAEGLGAVTRNASLVSWVVVLFGGFVINFVYTVFLLVKNKSYKTYFEKGAMKGYISVVLTGVMFFLALGLYGQGAAIMGDFGPVIGWTMFLALSLLVSGGWGIGAGEWKGVPKPLKVLLWGDAVLIVSWIILGYAQYVQNLA
ncbi:MAG: L-rhamnose/proton symporter RhaT [Planctomycetota bacterium]